MGFFIRKAFRAGPIRFNLSKGGVGVSAGVTGARLGLNRNGTYIYGGRHGIYYREQLNPGKKNTSVTVSEKATGNEPQKGPSDSNDIFVDTGVTYPSVYDLIEPHPFPDLKEISKAYKSPLLWIILIIFLLIPFAYQEEPLLWIIPGVILLIILYLFSKDRKWRSHGKEMIEELASQFEKAPEELSLNRMHSFVDKAPAKYINRFLPDLYAVMIQIILEEDDNAHVFAFNKFEKQIPVSDEFIDMTKKAILTSRMDVALQDQLLSLDQEQEIRELIKKLHLDDQFIFEELQYLDLASTIRKEMESALVETEASIPMVRGEICFAEFDNVRLLEERVIERFQQNRVQYRKIGFEIQLEGKLILTDRRLVVLGQGSREYRMNQILDVITDVETNIIELVISDRKNPVYITHPIPLLISTRLEKIRQG